MPLAPVGGKGRSQVGSQSRIVAVAGEGGFGPAPRPGPSHPFPVTNMESGKFRGSLHCPLCLCQGRSSGHLADDPRSGAMP